MAGMVQDAHSATLKSSFMSIQACTLARALLYSNTYESEQLASRKPLDPARKRVRSRPQGFFSIPLFQTRPCARSSQPHTFVPGPVLPSKTTPATPPSTLCRARRRSSHQSSNPLRSQPPKRIFGCWVSAVGNARTSFWERASLMERQSSAPDARHWLESQSFTRAEIGCIESALTDSQELTPQEWLKTLRGPYC